jgi:hypothetical protein
VHFIEKEAQTFDRCCNITGFRFGSGLLHHLPPAFRVAEVEPDPHVRFQHELPPTSAATSSTS